MADSNKTIRFVIKTVTEGGEEVKALQVDLKDLQEALDSTQKKASNGIKTKIDIIGMEAAIGMIERLNGMIQDLAEAYKVQEQAETKLAAAMRNTLNASEEEIQSIKDLCSAQQELGVIGDEVQLQGAERLSTYLETTQALKELIPVMNDLTVKMYGMDASGENSAAVAAMLGKAMQGNVSGLKKLGIQLDDAQKTILEFGTEEQKVAVITDVVKAKVGGMNAELAKTDSGKMKQLENTLGDLKEMAGAAAAKVAPLVNVLSSVGSAALGVSAIIKGYNVLMPVMSKVTAAATVKIKALSASMKGLLISTGVGIAIAALAWAIEELVSASDDASDSLDNLSESERRAREEAEFNNRLQEEASRTYGNTKAALDIYITRLKDFHGTAEEEKKLINELNEAYGDRMGYFASVSEWYDALIANSEDYCRQMMIEARIAKMKDRLAELNDEKYDIIYDENGNKNKYSTRDNWISVGPYDPSWDETYDKKTESIYGTFYWKKVDSDAKKAQKKVDDINATIGTVKDNIGQLIGEVSSMNFSVRGSKTPGAGTPQSLRPSALTKTDKEAKEAAEREKKEIEERRKIAETASKVLLDIQKEAIKDELDLMDDGYDKEMKRIQASYEEKMEAITKKEGELEDLRIREGKEGLSEYEKEMFQFARDTAERLRKKEESALKPLGAAEIKTYEELQKSLGYWNTAFNKASEEERGQIRQTIAALNQLQKSFDIDADLFKRSQALQELQNLDGRQYMIQVKATGMEGWLSQLREMQSIMADTSATDAQREAAAKLADQYRVLAAQSVSYFDVVSNGWGGIKSIGNNAKSLTEALIGQKDAWSTLTGVIDGILGIYQSVMQVMQMMNTLTQVFTVNKQMEAAATQQSTAATVEGAAQEVTAAAAVSAANATETTSEMADASAKTFAAHAKIPFVGIALAAGMVAAMIATMASLPKFANGGIVSGPTLGLMGEYAGASNNPEVIAPLDKLQSMIGGGGASVVVGGEMRVRGRDLVAVLHNQTSVASKSGKKTNIKL